MRPGAEVTVYTAVENRVYRGHYLLLECENALAAEVYARHLNAARDEVAGLHRQAVASAINLGSSR